MYRFLCQELVKHWSGQDSQLPHHGGILQRSSERWFCCKSNSCVRKKLLCAYNMRFFLRTLKLLTLPGSFCTSTARHWAVRQGSSFPVTLLPGRPCTFWSMSHPLGCVCPVLHSGSLRFTHSESGSGIFHQELCPRCAFAYLLFVITNLMGYVSRNTSKEKHVQKPDIICNQLFLASQMFISHLLLSNSIT